MHELSIALSIIEGATEELARHPGSRPTAVHLRLGRLSGVVKDALLFSWDLACQGTELEGATLEIQETEAGADLEVFALELTDEHADCDTAQAR